MIKYIWAKIVKKIRLSAIKNSQIDPSSKVESGSNIVNTIMGRHSFCGYNCEITYCEIGSFTSIANGVIIGGGMHPIQWVSMSPAFYAGRDSINMKYAEHERETLNKTIVGHDVWIGQNVLVKQGVTIGTGSVVGMGSVVTKDVPAYSIVAGNPAKVIKMRFSDEVSVQLLDSQWWNLSDEKLKKYAHLFKQPEAFLQELSK